MTKFQRHIHQIANYHFKRGQERRNFSIFTAHILITWKFLTVNLYDFCEQKEMINKTFTKESFCITFKKSFPFWFISRIVILFTWQNSPFFFFFFLASPNVPASKLPAET